MGTYTSKPDLVAWDRLAPVGTASEITALTDGSDSTYCKVTSYSDMAILQYNPTSIGAGQRVVSVCPYVRHKCSGTKKSRATVLGTNGGSGVALEIAPSASIANYQLAAHEGQLLDPTTGQGWDHTKFLYSAIFDPNTPDANRAWWYEAGLYLYTLSIASVSPPAALGTVTTTQYPTLEVQANAIVNDWQVPAGLPRFLCGLTVDFDLYPGHITTRAGSPLFSIQKRVEIDQYIDGLTASSKLVQATPPVPIPNGNWTLFCRATRDYPDGQPLYYADSYRQFTMNVPNPTTPALTLSKDDASQRLGVTVNASATSGYDSSTCLVTVQRQVDGGWRDVRGMVDVPLSVGSAVLVGYDYEADRGAANTYRARVSMYHTADAVTRYSAWATANATGYAATGWNLKVVDDPTKNWLVVTLDDPDEESQRDRAVFSPLDGEFPIVLRGTAGGRGGSYALTATGAAEIALLDAVEDAGLVRVEDGFGRAKYIVPGKCQRRWQGTQSEPVVIAQLPYTEVGSGLDWTQ